MTNGYSAQNPRSGIRRVIEPTSVDRFVTEHPGTTRSGVCAEALREWVLAMQEAEIERYYRTMSEQERAEDASWAAMAARGVGRLW